ncbi:MAG: hypothetical protein A4E71_00513 [Smithella sp. PtaU1.Bin162]|nr:MAG: hypothetical protein A4E71_00513 [Smithella sp. PtaU1.Bin162]
MTSRPPRQLNPGFSLAPSPSLRGGLIIVLSLVSVIFPARVEATGHWKPAEAAAQRLLEMEDKCVSQDKTDNINANAGDIIGLVLAFALILSVYQRECRGYKTCPGNNSLSFR